MKVTNLTGRGLDVMRYHLQVDGKCMDASGVLHDEMPDDVAYSPAVAHLVKKGAVAYPAPVQVEEVVAVPTISERVAAMKDLDDLVVPEESEEDPEDAPGKPAKKKKPVRK